MNISFVNRIGYFECFFVENIDCLCIGYFVGINCNGIILVGCCCCKSGISIGINSIIIGICGSRDIFSVGYKKGYFNIKVIGSIGSGEVDLGIEGGIIGLCYCNIR